MSKSLVVIESELEIFFIDVAQSDGHRKALAAQCARRLADKLDAEVRRSRSISGPAVLNYDCGFSWRIEGEARREMVNRELLAAIEDTDIEAARVEAREEEERLIAFASMHIAAVKVEDAYEYENSANGTRWRVDRDAMLGLASFLSTCSHESIAVHKWTETFEATEVTR